MKRILFLIVVFCLIVVFAKAQTYVDNLVPMEDMPAPENYLPQPPSLTSALYHNDFVQYQLGKEVRATERGALAVEDAEATPEYFMKRFGEAMGREMTPETYPAMAEFVYATYMTAYNSTKNAKNIFSRQRPYSMFKETSGVPEEENPDDYFHSYPSGHSVCAWSLALALLCVDPDHQDEILGVGYEIGQSRVIVGYHYQSDVEAGRLVAGAAFARLVIDPTWQELFRKAKEEFCNPTHVNQVSNVNRNGAGGTFTIGGYPASDDYMGIVISAGNKVCK